MGKPQSIRNKENNITIFREAAKNRGASTLANVIDLSSYLMYDKNDGQCVGSAAVLDPMTTNVPLASSIGASSVIVTSLGTFTVGQELTYFDDASFERPVIQAINVGTKQVTFVNPLTKAYKAGAQLCRSSMVQDTVNKLLKFNGWATPTTFTNTAVSVVASSTGDTSGNGGQRIVYLSNGWWVSAVLSAAVGSQLNFYKSTNNGNTWSAMGWASASAVAGGFSIASVGTIVYIILCNTGGSQVIFGKFDATTQTNVAITTSVNIDSSQSSLGACSLSVDSLGTIHATWCSKNATYSNGFNIRYSKSTDLGVTWAAVTQITSLNTAGIDITYPSIAIYTGNVPRIFGMQHGSGVDRVRSFSVAGAITDVSLLDGSSTLNPTVLFKQNGSNVGRLWVAYDILNGATRNLFVSYSDDGGVTFFNQNSTASSIAITTGTTVDRQKPTLSENTNGDVYVTYQDGTGISYQICANGGTTFTGPTTLNATGTNPSSITHLGLAFTVPPTVYMSGSSVLFTGTYIGAMLTPVLVEDARYNVVVPANISSAAVFVAHDTDANYSVDGAFSAYTTTEAMVAMSKASTVMNGTTTEEKFTTPAVAASGTKGTLRLTATRNSTVLNKSIQQIYGAALV